MLDATFRPLGEWPGQPTASYARQGSRFRSTYKQTLDLLESELGAIDAKDVVIQIALSSRDIRNDGWPRSGARPGQPGVVLSFVRGKEALQFACDTFDDWEANLRAIGKTLEALRAVDRYGATKGGEQYRGWAQLPPGEGYRPPDAPAMTRETAAAFLAEHSGITAQAILMDGAVRDIARMRATQKLHPDRGGDQEQFLRLTRAVDKLIGKEAA